MDRRTYELMVQGRDLPWLLRQWVGRTPDKTFLIWAPFESEHQQWTYAEFDKAVRQFAGGLIEQGIKKGDRLLIHMGNCPELLIAYFANALIGAVSVLGNTRSAQAELEHYFDLMEFAGVITQSQYGEALSAVMPGDELFIVATDDGNDESDGVSTGNDASPFLQLLKSPPFADDRDPDPFLDLRVQFTSGTTSRPKAVLSTHAK